MSVLELLSLLITTAALFGMVSKRWLRLPLTLGTMFLTVAASLCLLGLRLLIPSLHSWALKVVGSINFENLILHGMLPVLLFAGAFLLDLDALSKEKLSVSLLSVPGTLLSTVATAGLMWIVLPLIGLNAPWLHCLFFGALISPTDPVAVLEMLHRSSVPKNVQAQLAGESLFNDGIGAAIFVALLAASRGDSVSPLQFAEFVLLKAGGGLVLGVAAAWITSFLMRSVDSNQIDILLTIALAFGAYAVAESLHLAAPLAAVASGVALRHFNLEYPNATIAHERVDNFWVVMDEIQNAVLFVLLGLQVLVVPFSRLFLLAGVLAILSVFVVRLVVVSSIIGSLRRLQPSHRSSIKILTWGGIRGGLALALALSVPEQEGHPWILAATYTVVLFSILVQGGSLPLLLDRRREQGSLMDV